MENKKLYTETKYKGYSKFDFVVDQNFYGRFLEAGTIWYGTLKLWSNKVEFCFYRKLGPSQLCDGSLFWINEKVHSSKRNYRKDGPSGIFKSGRLYWNTGRLNHEFGTMEESYWNA